MDSPFYKIGLLCTAIVVFKIFKTLFDLLYDSVIARAFNLNKLNWKALGTWALVTGSTDGIGKAYSEGLAKKGFNMVLVSRTQSKLDAMAKDIKEQYNVEVKTIAADFTKEDIYEHIQKQVEDLEIGVLINNVGMAYDYPEYFLDVPNHAELMKNLINCNILSVMRMCKIVMPGMVKRRRGVVVNVSSTTSLIPNPMLTMYAATKAAVTKFSSDLSAEYRKDGLIIQGLCPGYVATKMSKIRKSFWMAPFPKEYVDSALDTVGLTEVTTGYLTHTLVNAYIHMVDGCSKRLSRYLVMNSFGHFRNRAFKQATKTE